MRVPCALLLLAIATPAQAGVVVGEGVPFSAEDLERALAARTRDVAALAIDVQAIAPDRLRVVGPNGRWDVELGEARGRAAARLVALNVLGDDGGDVDIVAPARPAARPARALALTVGGGASRGVGAADLAATVLAVEVTTGGRWRIGAGLDWRAAIEATPTGAEPVDGHTWLARALIGRAFGRAEVVAGPLVGRLRVDSTVGATAWQSGAAVAVRAGWAIAPGWTVVVGAGGDGYRHRIEVRRAGQVVATTPRVALAATVGLRWELGR